MTDIMNLNEMLSFESDITNPYAVITEISTQVETATRSFVKCEINKYDGPIDSYYEATGLLTLADVLSSHREYDIQKDLGEIGSTEQKYELFLSAKCFPNYKFRILFFAYRIGGYPVKLVLEQGVAKEFDENGKYVMQITSPEDLKTVITRILCSNRVVSIIQALINASRQEEAPN